MHRDLTADIDQAGNRYRWRGSHRRDNTIAKTVRRACYAAAASAALGAGSLLSPSGHATETVALAPPAPPVPPEEPAEHGLGPIVDSPPRRDSPLTPGRDTTSRVRRGGPTAIRKPALPEPPPVPRSTPSVALSTPAVPATATPATPIPQTPTPTPTPEPEVVVTHPPLPPDPPDTVATTEPEQTPEPTPTPAPEESTVPPLVIEDTTPDPDEERCIHCGDDTKWVDDPAPDICANCANAGLHSAHWGPDQAEAYRASRAKWARKTNG